MQYIITEYTISIKKKKKKKKKKKTGKAGFQIPE